MLFRPSTTRGGRSREARKTEKRTEIEEETTDVEHRRSRPGTTNVKHIGPDGEVQVEENEVVDDPVGTTTVRRETTIEERKEP